MQPTTAALDWRNGGVPVSLRFDDPYFSLDDGLAETAHVFHAGNGLPARFRDGFHVAELGFGTGLNLLATLALWRGADIPWRLNYTSFEAFPMTAADYTRAHAAFPTLAGLAADLSALWQGATQITLPDLTVQVIHGDARVTVPVWQGTADAWFLDGFSPAKNPELWEPGLMSAVHAHTVSDGTAASYTAAGHVRRALQDAGFTVTRLPGYGRKRHMTTARKG